MPANSTPQLRIARQVGMYGDCKDVSAFVGADLFGDAHYDHIERRWLVDIHHRDGEIVSHIVPFTESRAATLEMVEILFRLNYRSDYAPNRKAA